MSSHDHSHNDNHGHDHDSHDHTDDLTPALQTFLYRQIDFDRLVTLNEAVPDSGAAIVKKGWNARLDPEPSLFAGQVKLHSLHLRTSASPSAPRTLKLYLNTPDLDFSTATDLPPTQILELPRTSEIQDHNLKRALWNTTRSLSLFFVDNHSNGDEDVTRVEWVGLKGEFMSLSREPVEFLYEAAARPSDHPIRGVTANKLESGLGGGREGV
ncbi:MAG: hypothetical protein M1817_001669 [Caeruleum heppii]|nr:MAG: hypothetical protein M1817_001669 [Caeruleum heppii]